MWVTRCVIGMASSDMDVSDRSGNCTGRHSQQVSVLEKEGGCLEVGGGGGGQESRGDGFWGAEIAQW